MKRNTQSQDACVWEAITRRALQQIALTPGSRALDAGCGGGDAMRLIAARMQHRGTVVGVDVDAQLLESIRPQLHAEHPGIYRLMTGDLAHCDLASAGDFDLVFARLLLLQFAQPVEVLRRLWARVRPGGVLMIMDYDLTAARSVPPHSAVERALRLVIGVLRRADREIDIGTVMPTRFIEAGIGVPDRCEVNSVVLAVASAAQMLRALLSGLQPLILRAELADAAALERLETGLSLATSGEQFVRWPDLVTTWKVKPPT